MAEYYAEDVNYDFLERQFSWNEDDSIMTPYVMSCDVCGQKVNMTGPACKDKKCTNCGYTIKMGGWPDITYNDIYYTGHMNGRIGDSIDYHPGSTLDHNEECGMIHKSNMQGMQKSDNLPDQYRHIPIMPYESRENFGPTRPTNNNEVNEIYDIYENRQRKMMIGTLSAQTSLILIAVIIAAARNWQDVPSSGLAALCFWVVILCCPYLYIVYVIMTLVTASRCNGSSLISYDL